MYHIKKYGESIRRYSYEILVIFCIVFLLIYALIRKISGKKGTWSNLSLFDFEIAGLTKKRYIPEYTSARVNTCSKGENECGRVLYEIYKRPFVKVRPDFLRNHITEGNNLELDLYNHDLKLAVEYNGIQHYKYTPFFHRTKDAFYNQKYRDDMKRRLCRENGVVLIEVPYNEPNIREFIYRELKRHNKL